MCLPQQATCNFISVSLVELFHQILLPLIQSAIPEPLLDIDENFIPEIRQLINQLFYVCVYTSRYFWCWNYFGQYAAGDGLCLNNQAVWMSLAAGALIVLAYEGVILAGFAQAIKLRLLMVWAEEFVFPWWVQQGWTILKGRYWGWISFHSKFL